MDLIHILREKETKSEIKRLSEGSAGQERFSADWTNPVFLLWKKYQNHLQGSGKYLLLGPHPRSSEFSGSGVGPGNLHFYQVPR